MIEFINTYASEIVTIGSILIAITPAFIKRTISDKKLIKKFGDISVFAKDLDSQKLGIVESINTLNGLQNRIEKNVQKINEDIKGEIQEIKGAVLEFQNEELYQKMLNGLSKLNDLQELIKEKDNLIESYRTELKLVNKRLTKLEKSW